jgi:hypothetical protein
MNNDRYPKWRGRQDIKGNDLEETETNMGRRNEGCAEEERNGYDANQNWAKDRASWRDLCKPSTPIGRRGSD